MDNQSEKKPIDSTAAPADWAFPITDGNTVYLTFCSQPTNKDIEILRKYLQIAETAMPEKKNRIVEE